MPLQELSYLCKRLLSKSICLPLFHTVSNNSASYSRRLFVTHIQSSCSNRFKILSFPNKLFHPTADLLRKSPQHNLFRGLRMLNFGHENDVSKAVSHAEKIVGYPTSFLSLRCLLSDELSNVAMHMRKLVGTKHPLLKTARGLVFDGQHNLQTRGLLVMLISKAAGSSPEVPYLDKDMTSGIHASQRSLAEITEIIFTASLIHKGVVNLDTLSPEDGSMEDMGFGNKMAVLSGDYLLASACMGLAKLGNSQVVGTVASAIGDMMTAEFTQFTNANGCPTIPSFCNGFSDWLKQTFLATGSLLAKSCQSAMILAGHSEDIQEMAFNFGQNVSYSFQLAKDLVPFVHNEDISQLSLTSGPFLMYKEKVSAQEFTQLQHLWEAGPSHFSTIVSEMSAKKVIGRCQELCQLYRDKAISALQDLPSSDAKDALIKMATAMSEVR